MTDSYDLSSYSYAIFDIDVATYGNGTAHPAKIEISFDNGSSFTQTTTSATPSSSTYITGGPITLNSVSTQVIIRISNNGTSGRGVRLQNLVLTGYSLKPEPTNHVTNFSAVQGTPIHSSLDLSWTDAAGGTVPDGYLIKGSDVGYGSITDPVDGTAEADGGLVLNIAQGISTATFSGLNSETTYYFMIYPYTNTGDVIDYKTDGTVPSNDVATGAAPSLPNAWINEIHYDNGTPSTDANEGIEVVIENPSGYTLSDFSVILYNGSGGVVYDSKTVDNFTAGDIDNNFQYFYYMYPVNGIQNGPDGVALSYLGSLIQFLSYEGSFAATDGDANGITSTDIVVVEGGTTTDIQSLQLVGSGTQYSDFTWSADLTQTWGTANNGTQALPVELTSFTAYASANQVNLKWATATEVNNYGFEVERAVESPASSKTDYAGTGWEKIGFVEGAGNSNSPVEYNYIDKSVSNAGTYLYRLKQVDLDGAFEYSDEIEVTFAAPNKYQLEQNYPNPFNPVTS
ncbi:MAG: hypothetical protein K9J16_07330, partial [Melioribacteraceae bacterium]|nr:hypothetical protein [Melioribacteraceae bacterium]